MLDLRKLAAIDIAFLGPRFVIAEYACGAFLSVALGAFILFRSQSHWQVALGVYFLFLRINYAPMLRWAIEIRTKENTRAALGRELTDKRQAMSKYRRQSVVLFLPLLPLALIVRELRRRQQRGGEN